MPKSKPKKNESTSDSDSGPDDRAPPPKKSKDTGGGGDKNKSGGNNNQWVLEKQRQVRINEFRGKKLIDIREYYEKNGEILPGKKGISLSVSQWKKLLEYADEINAAIED
uniref:Transcriptional coactivator p15 (PC4) C-terminal domain-containing protein n=1 Tax=Musca domestica TaxID=7370 RepID=A0A1I8M2C4_MUSDO